MRHHAYDDRANLFGVGTGEDPSVARGQWIGSLALAAAVAMLAVVAALRADLAASSAARPGEAQMRQMSSIGPAALRIVTRRSRAAEAA